MMVCVGGLYTNSLFAAEFPIPPPSHSNPLDPLLSRLALDYIDEDDLSLRLTDLFKVPLSSCSPPCSSAKPAPVRALCIECRLTCALCHYFS